MKELKSTALAGEVQVYPYCFNLDIVGKGTVEPEGVTFPGAYKATDPGVTFQPFFTYGNSTEGATEWNSKYVSSMNQITRTELFLTLSLLSRSLQDLRNTTENTNPQQALVFRSKRLVNTSRISMSNIKI
jgi:hypothetical protein